MSKTVRKAKAPFREVILVCAKCAKKLGRGSGGKTRLRGELKRALKRRDLPGKVRLADVTCLDLCPKGRQVLATGRGLEQRRLWVIDKDVSADQALDAILADTAPAGAAADDALSTGPGRGHIGEERRSFAPPPETA